MSVWSNVNGTIKVSKGSSLSIRKLTQQHFNESAPSVTKEETNNYWIYSVYFEFMDDGMSAATSVDRWVAAMTEGWGASVDISADIRWHY
jgi:hypothetical protein